MATKKKINSIFSSLIITFIFIRGSNATDCNNVTCPSLIALVCPLDSVERIYKHNSESTNTNPNTSDDGFYVEVTPDNNSSEIVKNVRKRSLLQYKRESIVIVPGDHIQKRSIPEDDHNDIINILHGQMENQLNNASSVNNTEKIDYIKQCCDHHECVCKPDCIPPICEGHLTPIALKAGKGIPGFCCPTYRCDTLPNCKELPNDFEWWQPCKTCRCIKEQSFCHDTCNDEHQPSCYSLSRKRPYLSGEKWKEDECTLCECIYGDMKCQSSVCVVRSCLKKIKPHGECCPVCDNNETHFCAGEESCEYVCPHGFQTQPPTNCTLCKCAPSATQIFNVENNSTYYNDDHDSNQNNYSSIDSKTSITTSSQPKDDDKCNKENILILVIFLVTFAFIIYIFFSIYCWRNKRSYKMIPTVVDINLNKITTNLKSNHI